MKYIAYFDVLEVVVKDPLYLHMSIAINNKKVHVITFHLKIR